MSIPGFLDILTYPPNIFQQYITWTHDSRSPSAVGGKQRQISGPTFALLWRKLKLHGKKYTYLALDIGSKYCKSTHIRLIFMVHVAKYIPYMDPTGYTYIYI